MLFRSHQLQANHEAVVVGAVVGGRAGGAEGPARIRALAAEGAALAALSPRASRMLVESEGRLQRFVLDNPHPEVSWSALWSKVWYENYDEPKYVWQSTSANTDFEPKLSLAPLAFGTLKAAFYAMLLAAPLAICAAIYTAYFMAPTLRRKEIGRAHV